MPANFESNPQHRWVNGRAEEIELEALLLLAATLQAQRRKDESRSEVTPELELSDGCHIGKNP